MVRQHFMTLFSGKKVLVTGGGGFIASHLTRRLVKEGADVWITAKYHSIIDNVRLADVWGKISCLEADLRNPDALKEIAAIQPEIIYHTAAYNHVGDSFANVTEAIDVNGTGTVNLLEAYAGYERFIYVSSSEIYGHQEAVPFFEEALPFPISPYAVGKYAGECYARLKWHVEKKPIVVLRPFNTFGPYQSPRAIIGELIIKCLKGEDIVTTEGIQTRDFNYVENMVEAFILAAFHEEAVGKIINVGSGREISIRELTSKIHAFTRSSSRLRIGELPYRPTEIWRMAADAKRGKRLLGWEPEVDFEEGLKKTIEWYRKFIAVFCDESSELRRLSE
jgi:nucleoside-diphosphate-sugar epimerase